MSMGQNRCSILLMYQTPYSISYPHKLELPLKMKLVETAQLFRLVARGLCLPEMFIQGDDLG